jgi:hypothetical protein
MEISKLLSWEAWNLYNKNNTYNHRIYLAKEIKGMPRNELYLKLSSHPTLPNIDFISSLSLTSMIEKADYVLVPHAWIHLKSKSDYVTYLRDLSREVPLLIFNTGDVSPACNLSNTIELRTFLHPWEKKEKKIILPYPTKEKKYKIRGWKPTPTISFMGYIPKLGPGSLLGENYRGVRAPIKSSVYLNRKLSIYKLNRLSQIFEVKLKIRSSYTAYFSNPNLHVHKDEYDLNLENSDYILCPRGFGNTSVRFYETLSAGKIPILIDSGGVHPQITNSSFWHSNVINVGLFSNWHKSILDDWTKLSYENNYEVRQRENNKMFVNELKFEAYLQKLFRNYLPVT